MNKLDKVFIQNKDSKTLDMFTLEDLGKIIGGGGGSASMKWGEADPVSTGEPEGALYIQTEGDKVKALWQFTSDAWVKKAISGGSATTGGSIKWGDKNPTDSGDAVEGEIGDLFIRKESGIIKSLWEKTADYWLERPMNSGIKSYWGIVPPTTEDHHRDGDLYFEFNADVAPYVLKKIYRCSFSMGFYTWQAYAFPSGGGSGGATPTLAQVLAQGNVAGVDISMDGKSLKKVGMVEIAPMSGVDDYWRLNTDDEGSFRVVDKDNKSMLYVTPESDIHAKSLNGIEFNKTGDGTKVLNDKGIYDTIHSNADHSNFPLSGFPMDPALITESVNATPYSSGGTKGYLLDCKAGEASFKWTHDYVGEAAKLAKTGKKVYFGVNYIVYDSEGDPTVMNDKNAFSVNGVPVDDFYVSQGNETSLVFKLAQGSNVSRVFVTSLCLGFSNGSRITPLFNKATGKIHRDLIPNLNINPEIIRIQEKLEKSEDYQNGGSTFQNLGQYRVVTESSGVISYDIYNHAITDSYEWGHNTIDLIAKDASGKTLYSCFETPTFSFSRVDMGKKGGYIMTMSIPEDWDKSAITSYEYRLISMPRNYRSFVFSGKTPVDSMPFPKLPWSEWTMTNITTKDSNIVMNKDSILSIDPKKFVGYTPHKEVWIQIDYKNAIPRDFAMNVNGSGYKFVARKTYSDGDIMELKLDFYNPGEEIDIEIENIRVGFSKK